jgi:hypothetical protein
MQTAQSPLARRLNERNAKKLQEERRQMEESIPATEEQLPQQPVFETGPDRFDVTGDRTSTSGPKEAETEVSSEQLRQRVQRTEGTSQRVLFEENVRGLPKPDENSDRQSSHGPERARDENFSEKFSREFPECQEGKSEDQWFPDLGSQARGVEFPARKSVLDMFPTESFEAKPDTFIVNKMCALVPVEGTSLALRFVSLRNTTVCSLGQAYRELMRENEMKERFLLFEKDFESSVGNGVMQAVSLFISWLIEHLDCEDSQAIGLTLMVAVRRLMADKAHPERFRHAKTTLDYLC